VIGGIGGSIDLQTLNPLSVDHWVGDASFFYNWTSYKQLTPGVKSAGESYTGSVVLPFFHDTEGIFIGYAHTENPYEGEQFQAWGYPTAPDGNLILGGMRIYDQSELLTRDSAILVLESKPFDGLHNKLDVFLSYYNDDQELRGMEVPMAEWGNPTLQPGYTVTNGAITKYTLTNVNPVVRNMLTDWNAHLRSFIDNLDVLTNTDWPVRITGGWSSAKKSEEVLETYSGLGLDNTETDGSTWNVSQPAGPNPPSVTTNTDWSNASLFVLTDPQGWGVGTFPTTGQEGYLKYFQGYDIADSIKGEVKHELNWSILKDLEAGVIYSGRYKQFGQNPSDYLVNANGEPTQALPNLIGTTDLSWIGSSLHPIAYNAQALLQSGKLEAIPNPNLGSWEGDNYKVWEDLTRPYVMFDLKGMLGTSLPFTGNIGIMGDFTHQYSTGLSGNGGNIVTPVSGGANYAEALPSINLTFKGTAQDFIRLFAGREEMRPDMYYMRASRDYSYNASDALSTVNSPWGASSGNPELRPWLANSLDVDYEHYFAKGNGYFSFAFFTKRLLSYVYQQNTVESFAGYPYTGSTPPVLSYGVASQYVNGQGGNLSGEEATLQITSEAVSGGLVKGFGINVNGILVDSSIRPFGPTGPSDPLPDMSKKAATLTFYFERWGLSARVSDHYQGQTREYIVQFGAPTFNTLGSANDGYSEEIPFHTIDAQVSYSFKKGWFNGLTIYIEGRNLNNAPEITYQNGDPRQLANWQKYGASYRTGLSYKF